MNGNITDKIIALSMDFDRFVGEHPDFLARLPNGAVLAFTVKGNHAFNRRSKEISDSVRSRGERVVEARKEGRQWVLVP